jgi:hypothetical protein
MCEKANIAVVSWLYPSTTRIVRLETVRRKVRMQCISILVGPITLIWDARHADRSDYCVCNVCVLRWMGSSDQKTSSLVRLQRVGRPEYVLEQLLAPALSDKRERFLVWVSDNRLEPSYILHMVLACCGGLSSIVIWSRGVDGGSPRT